MYNDQVKIHDLVSIIKSQSEELEHFFLLFAYLAQHAFIVGLPFTSGMPDFGSDGVRCFTKDDVRGRVDGFAGDDSVVIELLA